MQNLTIEYQPLSALKLRASYPRTHSDKQIAQIANAISQFGFTNPILVGSDNVIIAGVGRYRAASKLSLPQVPTVRLSDMSEAELRAYVIADNKLAENAGWDRQLLALELQYLSDLKLEDLDLTITGFELPEIDILIGELVIAPQDDADSVPAPSNEPPVTKTGDVWTIAGHRLICGDSTRAETYASLLGSNRAQMVFSDPPYNVPVAGHVGGLGKIQHREFAMASGEMSDVEFVAFLRAVFEQLQAHSVDGAIHFQCIDWRHIEEMLQAGKGIYSELKNICVWSKNNAGMGSLYRSQHELVCVYKVGAAPHINNVELGRFGRYRTNVWTYAGVNAFGDARADLALHPTVKPVAMVEDAIRDCSRRNGIVLDPFLGSGTTIVAAARAGRRGFGIEIDPTYCDVALKRIEEACGITPILEATGQTFGEVSLERRREPPQQDAA